MTRKRIFIAISVAAALVISNSPVLASNPTGLRTLNIAQFESAIATLSPARLAELDEEVVQADIPHLQRMMVDRELSSVELTKYYLSRIKRYDVANLNSLTELNPDALVIAAKMDAERRTGHMRSSLHGTAAVLIDVIGTGDKMHNTAGALALAEAKSDRDAFVAKRLRDAGVVLLGKTSLMEWTGFIAFSQPFYYSTLGGQVFNPYGQAFDVWGSSNGSAVATAANFATFALAEETFGALTLPAVANSVAGLKPSMGLISRDRLIPNLPAHDTIGPMARNVTDLALVTDVLIGVDKNDPETVAAASYERNIAGHLNRNGLRGKRIGILPSAPEDSAINDQMIRALTSAGANVVTLPRQPDLAPDIFAELDPINSYAFRNGVESYLAATNAPFKTMASIVAFNNVDPATRVRYGQEYLQMAADSTMTQAEFNVRLNALNVRMKNQIDGLLNTYQLDMIAGTQFVVPFELYYAAPGYPALTIQAGYRNDGTPVGFVFTGRRFDDAKLIRAGYALEQKIHAWKPPKL